MVTTPTTSSDFDRAYRSRVTVWGDIRTCRNYSGFSSPGAPT
jgi:hypothetical protein